MRANPDKILPPIEVLRACFKYERSTGKLFWKKRPRDHFVSEARQNHWNRRWAGKEAGSLADNGYLTVGIFGVTYKVHRVVWKLLKEKEPPPNLDHKDRNRANNKVKNLRAASFAENFLNQSYSWSKLGHTGLKLSRCGNWEARIHKDKKYIHLGTFKSFDEAIAVRRKAAANLYGEFAP